MFSKVAQDASSCPIYSVFPAFTEGLTLSDLNKQAIQFLSASLSEREAAAQVRCLLLEYSGFKSYELSLNYAMPVGKKLYKLISKALMQLSSGKPLQYVLGWGEFYGMRLKLDTRVLIPRPETEELIRWVLDDLRLRPHTFPAALRILDIGTGSGAIAIALKENIQGSFLTALDASKEALDLAKENARLRNLDINFVQQDILSCHADSQTSFDLIVSNPPYIPLSESMHMCKNVLDYEPHMALFVPNEDPLLFYKAIAAFSNRTLVEKGLLYMEINEHYGEASKQALESLGFTKVILRKDLNGKPRMIRAERQVSSQWIANSYRENKD